MRMFLIQVCVFVVSPLQSIWAVSFELSCPRCVQPCIRETCRKKSCGSEKPVFFLLAGERNVRTCRHVAKIIGENWYHVCLCYLLSTPMRVVLIVSRIVVQSIRQVPRTAVRLSTSCRTWPRKYPLLRLDLDLFHLLPQSQKICTK